jgi:hypothetical protein
MTFYIIQINYYEQKSANEPAFWRFEGPKIFKSSTIIPIQIMFQCEEYLKKNMKKISYKKKCTGQNSLIKSKT